MAGGTTFDRGAEYAGADRVEALDSADRGRVLLAAVRGAGRSYQTLVTAVVPTAPVRWVSRCSCPVGGTCKHAVAVLLTARERVAPDAVAADGPAEWERRLAPLLGRPEQAGRSEPDGPAMALVVEVVDAIVQQGTRVRQVRLRPSRTTRTGTWAKSTTWADVVETGYAWNRPPPMHPRHREALTRLHRLSGASTRAYAGRTEVDLAGLGPAGWDALRQVAAAGVELIGAPGPSGEPSPVTLLDHPVDVGLDVVRDAAGLLVRARTEGLPAPAAADDEVLLVGDPAHGVVVRHGADLVLVPLASPLPNAVAALVLDPRPLRVPTEDADRFVALYLPRLALQVPVASSDGSVEITGPARPVLDVEVLPEPGHRTRLRLGVRYGEVRVRALGRDDPLPRDHGAERRLLDSLDVLDRVPGARTRASERVPWTLTPETVLVGMDAVRFVGEVLPVLQAHPDVHVAVVGELATFEEATEAPVIELATAETDGGGTDWFDLRVTVTVDGEEVPFEPAVRRARPRRHHHAAGVRHLVPARPTRRCPACATSSRRLVASATGPGRGPADQPVTTSASGTSWSRSASSASRPRAGPRASRPSAGWPTRPAPEVPAGLHGRRCGRTSSTASTGSARCWDARLGGVLADDMGLGKTVQVLALLRPRRGGRRARPPGPRGRPDLGGAATGSSEAARFVPGLRAPWSSADRARPAAERLWPSWSRASHVVVTSYAVLRLDADEYRRCRWRGLVLDEAQFVKNHQCQDLPGRPAAGRAVQARRSPAPRWRTRLMDLWSMLSIVAPGLFPQPEVLHRALPAPDRVRRRPELLAVLRRRIRPLHAAPHQGAGRRATCRPSRSRCSRSMLDPEHARLYRPAPAARAAARCSACSTTRTATGSRSCAR